MEEDAEKSSEVVNHVLVMLLCFVSIWFLQYGDARGLEQD